MPANQITDLLATANRQLTTVNGDFIATRPRAAEEAPMIEQRAESQAPSARSNSPEPLSSSPYALTAFVQPGAQLSALSSQLSDTFTITVTALPPGKPQRIMVEIPWADGLSFPRRRVPIDGISVVSAVGLFTDALSQPTVSIVLTILTLRPCYRQKTLPHVCQALVSAIPKPSAHPSTVG
jgi:hypothetical protein